jgi:hypothetical protein
METAQHHPPADVMPRSAILAWLKRARLILGGGALGIAVAGVIGGLLGIQDRVFTDWPGLLLGIISAALALKAVHFE